MLSLTSNHMCMSHREHRAEHSTVLEQVQNSQQVKTQGKQAKTALTK